MEHYITICYVYLLYENIFKGAYERPEKYVAKNKTRKVKKNYK